MKRINRLLNLLLLCSICSPIQAKWWQKKATFEILKNETEKLITLEMKQHKNFKELIKTENKITKLNKDLKQIKAYLKKEAMINNRNSAIMYVKELRKENNKIDKNIGKKEKTIKSIAQKLLKKAKNNNEKRKILEEQKRGIVSARMIRNLTLGDLRKKGTKTRIKNEEPIILNSLKKLDQEEKNIFYNIKKIMPKSEKVERIAELKRKINYLQTEQTTLKQQSKIFSLKKELEALTR